MPARWPSTRANCRVAAQRPLPSMMMATWRGRRSKSTRLTRASSTDPGVTAVSISARDMAGVGTKKILSLRFGQISYVVLVFHRHKRESAGRCGQPRGGAIPGRDHRRHRLDRSNPGANFAQRPGDRPDHVTQEAIALDVHDDLAAVFAHLAARQRAHGVGDRGAAALE